MFKIESTNSDDSGITVEISTKGETVQASARLLGALLSSNFNVAATRGVAEVKITATRPGEVRATPAEEAYVLAHVQQLLR